MLPFAVISTVPMISPSREPVITPSIKPRKVPLIRTPGSLPEGSPDTFRSTYPSMYLSIPRSEIGSPDMVPLRVDSLSEEMFPFRYPFILPLK
ncbi:MAG: hypothetical protein DRP30_07410 [Thermotoga sp.]|nr:MAG: hypothetical protein DRP30_07410 [Thermotoga sp.]